MAGDLTESSIVIREDGTKFVVVYNACDSFYYESIKNWDRINDIINELKKNATEAWGNQSSNKPNE